LPQCAGAAATARCRHAACEAGKDAAEDADERRRFRRRELDLQRADGTRRPDRVRGKSREQYAVVRAVVDEKPDLDVSSP
jgi:hypothetical protein